MKAFLSSLSISTAQLPAFEALVGKSAAHIKLALIENAADGQGGDHSFVVRARESMLACGIQVTVVDLNEYTKSPSELKSELSTYDVIWIGGGNTIYLRWLLRKTKADTIITDLVRQGTVYGGGSAGAIVAGPTIKHFELAEDATAVPSAEIVWEGMNLINVAVLPHWDNAKYGEIMKTIQTNLEKDGIKTQPLTDKQALVITDGSQELIG